MIVVVVVAVVAAAGAGAVAVAVAVAVVVVVVIIIRRRSTMARASPLWALVVVVGLFDHCLCHGPCTREGRTSFDEARTKLQSEM